MALLRAAHLGPTVTVTTLTALLASAVGLDPATGVLAVIAVLTGQLVIGWSNDLLDAERDREVHRTDKPLATGLLTDRTVRVALGLAVLATLAASLSLGVRSGLVHLVAVVGAGLAYNLGLKATAWSWLPYAVAFGALPLVLTLAATPAALAASWLVGAGAALGVAAHFLNVLPDLADDAATGVAGLPHRLGADRSQLAATGLLLAASTAAVLGPDGPAPTWAWVGLVVAVALAAIALTGRGTVPFRAAIAIALVDVALVTLVGAH